MGGACPGRRNIQRSPTLFERFTDRARRVIVLAQNPPETSSTTTLVPAHPARPDQEGEGVAAKAWSLNVTYDAVQEQVIEIIGEGQ